MKKIARIIGICCFTALLLLIGKPGTAADPPMPPETHNEETDKDMGGGAPLEDDLLFYLGIAGFYLTIRGSRKLKEQSSG